MRYRSTRGGAAPVGFSEAILAGLAPDGGLYVPERFPDTPVESFDAVAPFPEIACRFLEPFVTGDPLERGLRETCSRAFDFPLRLEFLEDDTALLELFHGPTAAFKDFGARFLATSFERIVAAADAPLTVLVATSGDTGSAVASAFHGRAGIRVVVLYPHGGVAPRQEHQLTCWGGNVTALAVRGTFDDCQRMVKSAFLDPSLAAEARLTSANSINVGRLLPQAAYYAAAALRFRARTGDTPGVIVPTGNVGNAVGAFWARRIGFPVGRVVMATNANRPIPDWFAGGAWRPRVSVRTLANAMDVGDPSNMERLFDLYADIDELRTTATAESVDDDAIRRTIAEGPSRWNRIWCPHTATAIGVLERHRAEGPWIVVATAHPAKFDTIVEPLIGAGVDPPPQLAETLARPARSTTIDADLEALRPWVLGRME